MGVGGDSNGGFWGILRFWVVVRSIPVLLNENSVGSIYVAVLLCSVFSPYHRVSRGGHYGTDSFRADRFQVLCFQAVLPLAPLFLPEDVLHVFATHVKGLQEYVFPGAVVTGVACSGVSLGAQDTLGMV